MLAQVGKLAQSIATAGPQAVRASKRLLGLTRHATAMGALAEEARTFADLFDGDEQKEGMAAFVEKRTPAFAQGGTGENA